MVRFTDDLYWTACTLAGAARHGYKPHGINLLTAEPKFPDVRKAVYFVVDRAETVAYVGKVGRRMDLKAVRSRLAEHVNEPLKASTWARLYIVPLKSDTPTEVVEYIESVVGARLEPHQNKRLPKATRRAQIAGPYIAGGAL